MVRLFMIQCMYLSSNIAKDAGVQLSGSPVPYRTKARVQQKGINVFGLIFFFIAAALLLGTKTGRSMLPWILLLFLSGGRGGGWRRRFRRRLWRFWRRRQRRRRGRWRFLITGINPKACCGVIRPASFSRR